MLLGRLLKILTPEYETPFWTQVRPGAGKYKWFLFLVLRPCAYAFVRKSCWFSIINSIKDSIYWHGTGKILSFLNRFLHEDLGPIPDIILITLFCSLNTCCACAEFPPKIIPYRSTGWKYAKYTIRKISAFKVWVKFLIVKHATLNLWDICSIWIFQFIWLSICIPKNLMLFTSSRT